MTVALSLPRPALTTPAWRAVGETGARQTKTANGPTSHLTAQRGILSVLSVLIQIEIMLRSLTLFLDVSLCRRIMSDQLLAALIRACLQRIFHYTRPTAGLKRLVYVFDKLFPIDAFAVFCKTGF